MWEFIFITNKFLPFQTVSYHKKIRFVRLCCKSHHSYKNLLDFFFQIHNPTTLNQQGNDRGTSYRSAIFYADEQEKKEVEEFIKIVDDSKRWKDPVVTTIEPLNKFYLAEDYHQDYLVKNPGEYTCHAIYFDSYLPAGRPV